MSEISPNTREPRTESQARFMLGQVLHTLFDGHKYPTQKDKRAFAALQDTPITGVEEIAASWRHVFPEISDADYPAAFDQAINRAVDQALQQNRRRRDELQSQIDSLDAHYANLETIKLNLDELREV